MISSQLFYVPGHTLPSRFPGITNFKRRAGYKVRGTRTLYPKPHKWASELLWWSLIRPDRKKQMGLWTFVNQMFLFNFSKLQIQIILGSCQWATLSNSRVEGVYLAPSNYTGNHWPLPPPLASHWLQVGGQINQSIEMRSSRFRHFPRKRSHSLTKLPFMLVSFYQNPLHVAISASLIFQNPLDFKWDHDNAS